MTGRFRLAIVGATFAWLLEGLLVPVWRTAPVTDWLR